MQTYHSHSTSDTEKIGADLAAQLNGKDVILLYGEMGAGKTAFVRGLVLGLGLDAHTSSPTFTIVNEYGGTPPLYHFDLYRLGSIDELYDIGFEEYLANGICVIEWPEIARPCLTDYIEVRISKDEEKGIEYRRIEIA